ncbi:MAG: DMT family transporter [Spirochaetales bacterium]|nr:MAG: DMT family transporter [Spirochaetales bacterium]
MWYCSAVKNFGELIALSTAVCWTITAFSFELAAKRIGSLSLNLIRLLFAFVMFMVLSMVIRGMPLPLDAPPSAWFWLAISGLFGFVLGDLFLFQAFVLIGARVSMLIYSSVPLMTVLLGRFILDERLSWLKFLGMGLTIIGISLVVIFRPKQAAADKTAVPSALPAAPAAQLGKGVLFAFLGALGQALGYVLGKYGAGSFDAFGSTQIRSMAGIAGFAVIITIARRWKHFASGFRVRRAMIQVTAGSFFGPFLGVSLSLLAVQHTSTGIASTIIATVPVLIIPPSIIIFREKVSLVEILGAVVSIAGVGVMFV